MTFNLKQCALVCGALALAATSAAARTVVDDNGTSVEIPDHVNRVVVTNILPLASAVTVFLNDGKTVVGMHPASYSAAKSGLLGKLYPDVLKADTSKKYDVKGYADNYTGSDAINNRLRKQRSENVVKQLVSRGVSADQVTAVPVQGNLHGDNEALVSLDRCAVIVEK